MSNAHRRRGRPNRGGGKYNQGRGGGGGHGGSHGPRKVGAYALHDDDFSVDAPYDPPVPNNTRNDRGGRGKSRATRKVTMQRLHMSAENQDMVRDMLRDLRVEGEGEEQQIDNEDEYMYEEEYKDLNIRTDHQYWLKNNQMVVEDVVGNSGFVTRDFLDEHDEEDIQTSEVASFSSLAVNKLQRYGFETARCEEALRANNGDIGASLTSLLTQCFNLTQHDSSESDKTGAFWEDINEQRNEEMTVLSSIYGEAFKEKVPGQVWTLSLEMKFLSELVSKNIPDSASSKRHDTKTRIEEMLRKHPFLCKYHMRGACKFGTRCRYEHISEQRLQDMYDATFDDVLDLEKKSSSYKDYVDEEESHQYELEVRFPDNNTYPLESPLLAFSTTNVLMPQHVCLNITARLMKEAADLAESQLPSIFSVVSILENESEIEDLFRLPPMTFSLQEPVYSKYKTTTSKIQTKEQSLSAELEGSRTDRDDLHIDEDKNKKPKKADHSYKPNRNEVPPKVNMAEIRRTDSKLREKFRRKQDSEGYKKMQSERQKLPAWDECEGILQTLGSAQVIVISGMTGCGKTTQIPQFILDKSLNSSGERLCNIVCTQPRRISAIGVADRVAKERAERLGGIVGYQIRMENMQSSSTRLLFCTTGILLRRLEGDPSLQGLTHVIIDEVHERTEESDFLMMILRDLLPQRPDLKLILMSATMNATLFSTYFMDCPVAEIPGRTFPVDQFFLEEAIQFTGFQIEEGSPFARPLKHSNASKYAGCKGVDDLNFGDDFDIAYSLRDSGAIPKDSLQDQNLTTEQLIKRYSNCTKSTLKTMATMDHEKLNYDLIEAILLWIVQGKHQYPKDGAVLVFLPGYAEINTMFEQLNTASLFGKKDKYKLIPLHSTLSSEDQQAVFMRPKAGITKIVLATNIAETSITIDDVVYVIDAGRMKEKRYDATKSMESLDTVWVTRANAVQRKGRAGRVAAGVAFHLFTSHRFSFHLDAQQLPEIQRAPLEQLILKIKLLHIFDGLPVEEVMSKLLEPPTDLALSSSIHRLQDLNALDEAKNLTPLGYHLAFLPVDVRIGKLMLFGAIFRCLDPALTIAATLSFKSPFVSPFDKRDEADKRKQKFAVGNSDHLTMLKAYQGWISSGKKSPRSAYVFCQENYLSIKTLQMLASMKRQFTELLSDIGFLQEKFSASKIERMARYGSDGVMQATGPQANENSENMKLVAAILVAALYPNVVQVMTPESKFSMTGAGAVPIAPKAQEIKFKTKMDGYVHIHPMSINFQVRYYESPYLVFHEKVKTSKVYLRDCTMVSIYALLLFGGGSVSVDLNRGEFIMSVDDGWIRFMIPSHHIGELLRELRLELDQLLEDKIEKPQMDLCTCPRGSKIIATIVRLITTQ